MKFIKLTAPFSGTAIWFRARDVICVHQYVANGNTVILLSSGSSLEVTETPEHVLGLVAQEAE
jgi:hypothetical protein